MIGLVLILISFVSFGTSTAVAADPDDDAESDHSYDHPHDEAHINSSSIALQGNGRKVYASADVIEIY